MKRGAIWWLWYIFPASDNKNILDCICSFILFILKFGTNILAPSIWTVTVHIVSLGIQMNWNKAISLKCFSKMQSLICAGFLCPNWSLILTQILLLARFLGRVVDIFNLFRTCRKKNNQVGKKLPMKYTWVTLTIRPIGSWYCKLGCRSLLSSFN